MIWLLIDSSSVGGAERHIATLAQSLARLRIPATVVLYAGHGANPWLAQLATDNVPVRILGNSFARLFAALRRDRPRLLHTHGYKAGVLGRLAGRVVGVPVVSTFHSGSRGKFPVGVYDWLDEWTSILCHRIVVSEAIQRRLPFRSTHIPSFVLTPETPPTGPLSRRVGFVGRLSEEKGPDIFCEIARRARPGVEWHVYGDGPMRGALERDFGAVVRFHGVAAKMEPVWSSLGLLLMPSRSEGVPLAALEALARGVPVLASRAGGLPSVVIQGATGWLFEPNDIREAMERLETWRAQGPVAEAAIRRSCWNHVRENFSEARHMPGVLAVYRAAGLDIATSSLAASAIGPAP